MPSDPWAEAAELADRYNWPKQAADLRRQALPDGFGREVGRTIALFLERPVIGWGFFGWSRRRADEHERDLREHARVLVKLRVLLARLYVLTHHPEFTHACA